MSRYSGPNPGTTRRTFTRQQLDAARFAWDHGEFGGEWREVRYLATMAGIIDPPTGTRWDQWGDDEPSERAIVSRAMSERPTTLLRILRSGRVHTWSQVVRVLVRDRDRLAESADEREREWQAVRRGAPVHAGSIARMILDSLDRADAR